jgi:hypothetical protein
MTELWSLSALWEQRCLLLLEFVLVDLTAGETLTQDSQR